MHSLPRVWPNNQVMSALFGGIAFTHIGTFPSPACAG